MCLTIAAIGVSAAYGFCPDDISKEDSAQRVNIRLGDHILPHILLRRHVLEVPILILQQFSTPKIG